MQNIKYYLEKINLCRQKLINILRDKNIECDDNDTLNTLTSKVYELSKPLSEGEKIDIDRFSLSFFQGTQEEIDEIIDSFNLTKPMDNIGFRFSEVPNMTYLPLYKFNITSPIPGFLEMFDTDHSGSSGANSNVEEIDAHGCDMSYIGDNEAFDSWIVGQHRYAPKLKKLNLDNAKICRQKLFYFIRYASLLEELSCNNMTYTDNDISGVFSGSSKLNSIDFSTTVWEKPIIKADQMTCFNNAEYVNFGNIIFENVALTSIQFKKITELPFSDYTLKNSTFTELGFYNTFSEPEVPCEITFPNTTITGEKGLSIRYAYKIKKLDISNVVLNSEKLNLNGSFYNLGNKLTEDELNDAEVILPNIFNNRTITSLATCFYNAKILKGAIEISNCTLGNACDLQIAFFGTNIESFTMHDISTENYNEISFYGTLRQCFELKNVSITLPRGQYKLTYLIFQSPKIESLYLNIPTCDSSGNRKFTNLNTLTYYGNSGGGTTYVYENLKEMTFENMYISGLPATNGYYNTGSWSANHMPYLERINLINCEQSISDLSYFMYNSLSETIDLGNISGEKITSFTNGLRSCANLINLTFMQDYGKGFTSTTNKQSSYTINLSASSSLTKDSLLDVINKIYDLKITYKNNSNPVYQELILGATNLAKLTPEEIAIATNKNWIVS